GSMNHRCIQLGLGIRSLALSLSKGAFGAGDFLCTRSNLGQSMTLLERMNALLAGFVLCGCIIQCLFRNHALLKKVLCTIEVNFVIRGCSPGLAQIVLCLLD